MASNDRQYGDITVDAFDEQLTPDLIGQPKTNPLDTIGVTGVRRNAGIIDEEFLPALRGRKAVKVFREMSLNDPIVGALLFTFEQLLRQTEWNVEPSSQEEEDLEAADFLESCMDDMSKSWGDVIAEIVSMLTYGWCWSEIVYKKRVGPWEKDPKKRSKKTDGMIGWRKIEIRSQETMMRWIFDDDGQVAAMVQMAPPKYKTQVIPIDRSLLFRFKENKGSPEGTSMLRNAYRPWFFKKRLEEFEAIGVERDLAGMPVAKIPAHIFNAQKNSPEYKTFQAFKQMVRGIRRDEHEGIVMPQAFDKETKQPLYEFELMSAGGARQLDTSRLIERYEQRILMSVLADFILIGHQGQGSYAMHVDKTGIFRAALNAVAKSIADVFNRHAIPKLFSMNGWQPEALPKITPSNVDSPNLTELAGFMSQMANMGMEWFPDGEIENFLRKTAGLPDLPEDKIELRRVMQEKLDMMGYAQTQMDAMSAKQKAEMVAEGATPEEAEAAQNPQPEVDPMTGEEIPPEEGGVLGEEGPPGGGMDPAAVEEAYNQEGMDGEGLEAVEDQEVPEQVSPQAVGDPEGHLDGTQEGAVEPVEPEVDPDTGEALQEPVEGDEEEYGYSEAPVVEPSVEASLAELGDEIGDQADEIELEGYSHEHVPNNMADQYDEEIDEADEANDELDEEDALAEEEELAAEEEQVQRQDQVRDILARLRQEDGLPADEEDDLLDEEEVEEPEEDRRARIQQILERIRNEGQ